MAKRIRKDQIEIINGRLGELLHVADKIVPKLIKETIRGIGEDVRASAPVRSGNLRNSIYETVSDFKGKVQIDTTKTEVRNSSRNFNYGYTVEHGRAGRYKTTPYFYKNVNQRLAVLLRKLGEALRDAAIRGNKNK
jgi:hypothetical protein